MAAKHCPHCQLINPEIALVCDCGYPFDAIDATDALIWRGEQVKSHNTMAALGFVMLGVGVVLVLMVIDASVLVLPTGLLVAAIRIGWNRVWRSPPR